MPISSPASNQQHTDSPARLQIKELEDDLARCKATNEQLHADAFTNKNALRKLEVSMGSSLANRVLAGDLAILQGRNRGTGLAELY